jgi:DNA-binding MarR family transcriptional regulator/CheY-like chemotaxis protein
MKLPPNKTVNALVIDDSPEDTFLLIRELSTYIPGITHTRVEKLNDLKTALDKEWDIILCDFNLPEFDGLTALHMIRDRGINTPFILVSGVVEESIAASMMRLGANDYIMKDNLKRLAPAVMRELAEAELRKELKSGGGNGTGTRAQPSANTGLNETASVAGTDKSDKDKEEGKHTELLEFIEHARKQAGQGSFIKERHKAVVNILYVANLVKKHQDKILEREGLTEQQFNVLRLLKRHYPKDASVNVVREGILNKTADVSRIIERMVKLGMINYAKNENDKRVRNISISEKGLAMLDQMNNSVEDMFLSEKYLPESDAKIINEKLKKILDAMGE